MKKGFKKPFFHYEVAALNGQQLLFQVVDNGFDKSFKL